MIKLKQIYQECEFQLPVCWYTKGDMICALCLLRGIDSIFCYDLAVFIRPLVFMARLFDKHATWVSSKSRNIVVLGGLFC